MSRGTIRYVCESYLHTHAMVSYPRVAAITDLMQEPSADIIPAALPRAEPQSIRLNIRGSSLLRTTAHYYSPWHFSSCELLHPTPNYCELLLAATHYSELLRTTASCCTLLRTTLSCCTLLRTTPNCCTLLRTPAHNCCTLLQVVAKVMASIETESAAAAARSTW
jgi:hypothetical protein